MLLCKHSRDTHNAACSMRTIGCWHKVWSLLCQPCLSASSRLAAWSPSDQGCFRQLLHPGVLDPPLLCAGACRGVAVTMCKLVAHRG